MIHDDRQHEPDDDALKALLEGLESGEGIPITPEFWRDVRAEARAIADKHRRADRL